MRDLLERALYAYARHRYRRSPFDKLPPFYPDYEKSGVYQLDRRDYVVIRGPADQVMAVFRIRPSNGGLRRLFNYPLALEDPPKPKNILYRRKKT